MSYTYQSLSASNVNINDIAINGSSGSNKQVIYDNNGVNEWKQITGLVSQFQDTTNKVQDLNGSPIPISFDTEQLNLAGIAYGVTEFTINDPGIYRLEFQCLMSDCTAQTMISFEINSVIVYGNLTTFAGTSINPCPFYMYYDVVMNASDNLRVIGEKYNGGPNFLLNNPLYSNPITMLTITKIGEF